MATALHNLSEYDPTLLPSAATLKGQRYAIVVADWNPEITYAMAQGAMDTLVKAGVPEESVEVVHVPGTVELTYAAARFFSRPGEQPSPRVDAVIVIGCVIQGDTPHFDYVCQSVTQGVAELNARGEIPVIFSVLTTLNREQALDRAGGRLGNKGTEGAYTAIRMANL